ncbi:acyl transferase/acyl hydrolase/lysophospholipase [Mariannaea sp. PMI_226]|nr:acyl transferase/acyl hydrolase/lysophospholipase [Mariannaea sp. PMI_226]
MVILRAVRQSPAYLYVKAYCLCALVSLFKTTPISSAISHVKHQLNSTHSQKEIILANSTDFQVARRVDAHALRATPIANNRGGHRNPGPNTRSISNSIPKADSGLQRVIKRWQKRAEDLSAVKTLLRRDDKDIKTYPELEWDATVRCSSSLHPDEQKFIKLRQERISSAGSNSLHKFLDLPPDEAVDPRDVPLVALGGSGGGYRAMYGFAAFISSCKKGHLWDCMTWTAAVSGSCWTLGAYYTIACQDISKLMQHYLSVAKELVHPISISALNTVIRSGRGMYFLMGPLVRKAQCSIIGVGIMDLYATLIATYQFLSRRPGGRLSRATFQLSKLWSRSGISKGLEPMPIFTAVRRAPTNASGVKANQDSSISKGQPPKHSLAQHDFDYLKLCDTYLASLPESGRKSSPNQGLFQWFEISPLEVGCAETQRYIPSWAWGRTFMSGKSVERKPEQSLSLVLGQCTSAPAGPLTGYISALLASIPKGTIMSRVLFAVNKFASMKRWERLWANPIRAGHDPNPFYGLGHSPMPQTEEQQDLGWHLRNFGVSELDTSQLLDLAARSTSKWLDDLARRVFTEREWEEVNMLIRTEDPEKRKQAIAHYLSIAWAVKTAAYKAMGRLYNVSWGNLVISTEVFSRAYRWDRQLQDQLVNFSSRFQEEHGLLNLPKLHLSLTWAGERVTARVVAEKRSFSTLSRSEGSASESVTAKDPKLSNEPWEAQGRVSLMDSGMSNNLPNHILARPERCADVIIAFDASSDVQRDSAIKRIHNFAEDCHLELEDQTELFGSPARCHPGGKDGSMSAKAEFEAKFIDRYARVFRARRPNGDKLYLVYCPLLPNVDSPEYNPSEVSFSTSYNLVWTPEQVSQLFKTAEANATDYAMNTIKKVMKRVYEMKKEDRIHSHRHL